MAADAINVDTLFQADLSEKLKARDAQVDLLIQQNDALTNRLQEAQLASVVAFCFRILL